MLERFAWSPADFGRAVKADPWLQKHDFHMMARVAEHKYEVRLQNTNNSLDFVNSILMFYVPLPFSFTVTSPQVFVKLQGEIALLKDQESLVHIFWFSAIVLVICVRQGSL